MRDRGVEYIKILLKVFSLGCDSLLPFENFGGKYHILSEICELNIQATWTFIVYIFKGRYKKKGQKQSAKQDLTSTNVCRRLRRCFPLQFDRY